MTLTLFLFAFLAGVATIVSPCVLPVLPLVLTTSAGGGRLRPLGVVLGFAATFTVATLLLASILQALGVPADWLRTIAIVALGLFGLSLLIPAWGRVLAGLLSPLSRLAAGNAQRTGFGGGVLMGAGLGMVWSPCVGPIMATVIAASVTTGVTADRLAITLAYALGAGLPMLAIGYGARSIATRAKGLSLRSEGLRRAFGALTVLTCLALFFGFDSRLQSFVPTQFNTALTGFESSDNVQRGLDQLDQQQQSSLPPIEAALQPTPVPPTLTPVLQATATTQAPAPPTAVADAKPGASQPGAANSGPNPGLKLSDMGAAPELTGITGWINSKPLTLEALRGKVVIVDFWTFECYNCLNTKPYVKALYDEYKSQGLEILGIHTPEFAFERVPDNVRAAVKDQEIDWPVALDPGYKTWSAFNNRYWPAFYFIDATGHIRYTHFGEGNYEYNEKVVQQLLYEAKSVSSK